MRLPIILDTDPGIDDAAAIAAALFAPELGLQLARPLVGVVEEGVVERQRDAQRADLAEVVVVAAAVRVGGGTPRRGSKQRQRLRNRASPQYRRT